MPLAPHSPRQSPNCAFTRTDLGVLLAVVGLLAVLATSVLGKISPAAHRAVCANNLRQLGVATLKFAGENKNLPPWYVLPADGGTAGRQLIYEHLAIYSNYVDSPRILVCPSDNGKRPALDFSTNDAGFMRLGNQAVGYTIMTELSMETPRSLLMGDRLATGGRATTCSGIGNVFSPVPVISFDNSRIFYWLPELHGSAVGNLLFADGMVQSHDSAGLAKAYYNVSVDQNHSGCTMMP